MKPAQHLSAYVPYIEKANQQTTQCDIGLYLSQYIHSDRWQLDHLFTFPHSMNAAVTI